QKTNVQWVLYADNGGEEIIIERYISKEEAEKTLNLIMKSIYRNRRVLDISSLGDADANDE
ncbi:MAG: hypothetical protein NC485_12880, partial [Ruminococcus flavefaciens]|nr:hypothetical protein [Ruminococcus flavefaciens]